MRLLAAAVLLAGTQDPDLSERVRGHAAALKEEKTRRRAVDRLSHLGPAALRLLEKEDLDPVLLARILEDAALHERIRESYGPPRTVTLEAEETLAAALSKIETAAGMSFVRGAIDGSTKVSLSLRDAPFWEALDGVCRQAGVAYSPAWPDRIYLNPGVVPEKPVDYHGPLRIVLDRFLLHRRNTFDRTVSELGCRLICHWERHVQPLGASRRFRVLQALDDAGRSLLPDAPDETEPSRPPATYAAWSQDFVEIRGLKPPAPGVKKIALLDGSFELDFPAAVETVRFAPPWDPSTSVRRSAGLAVELRSCMSAPSSNGVIVDLAFVFDDEKEAAAARINARILDFVGPADQKQPGHAVSSRLEKNVVGLSVRCYSMPRIDDLKELVLRVPRGRIVKQVPFRFADVELK
jgi:hypothetical protein